MVRHHSGKALHNKIHFIAESFADIFYVAMATHPMNIMLPAQETLYVHRRHIYVWKIYEML